MKMDRKDDMFEALELTCNECGSKDICCSDMKRTYCVKCCKHDFPSIGTLTKEQTMKEKLKKIIDELESLDLTELSPDCIYAIEIAIEQLEHVFEEIGEQNLIKSDLEKVGFWQDFICKFKIRTI